MSLKFNIGDEVQVVEPLFESWVGKTGIVTAIAATTDHQTYTVKLENGSSASFYTHELTHSPTKSATNKVSLSTPFDEGGMTVDPEETNEEPCPGCPACTQIGDKVMFIGGGPVMVVTDIAYAEPEEDPFDEDEEEEDLPFMFRCMWYDEHRNEFLSCDFPIPALVKVVE